MLTEKEIQEAFNSVANTHNRVVMAFDDDDIATKIEAECLQFGINSDALVQIIRELFDNHTDIPLEVIHEGAPWAIQTVRHGILLGIELGKLMNLITTTTGSDVRDNSAGTEI